MLSSTADHIFWMSRYVERAENTARMLSVNHDTALMPESRDAAMQGWTGVLSISELQPDYMARYGKVTPEQVLHFMALDPLNPSSIYSCLKAARENARAVRGALTTEVWETHNMTWLELHRFNRSGIFERDPGRFFEWVKYRSHLSRGVALGTMLHNEAFHFLRLGTFLERADNTARLLDVKFHALEAAPSSTKTLEPRSHTQEYYHWVSLLRSVSAFEVYRQVYRDVVSPKRIAELLILRRDMPRSLHASMLEVMTNLSSISNDHSGKTERRAGRLLADLQYATIDEILTNGLHAFLTQFLERVNDLGMGVSKDFLVH
ncbi:alpha-E domain-containing protein [Lampropedia aestuarii]|uniref:Alpha-E domain-containing protein n=1 Tax=Lampropedia aestuarii TaxID=2562762 RepID=A0A4S5BZN3_9BURK|nr:alpha-E domain-containing protein [Lampropedia aestuarii]MDH5855866.1 alpha-E domain-containing protein [Lampropedia aestuarii]THJ35578.1 alpha-E domain-containing protein [Lampropedia aestuarii]